MPQLKREILEAAVEGLEARLARLDERIAMVRSQLGGGRSAPSASDTILNQTRREAQVVARRTAAYRRSGAPTVGGTEIG